MLSSSRANYASARIFFFLARRCTLTRKIFARTRERERGERLYTRGYPEKWEWKFAAREGSSLTARILFYYFSDSLWHCARGVFSREALLSSRVNWIAHSVTLDFHRLSLGLSSPRHYDSHRRLDVTYSSSLPCGFFTLYYTVEHKP